MTRWNVYVGCFTADLWDYFARPPSDTTTPSTGIERLVFDDASGSLTVAGSVGGDLSSPQYLSLDPDKRVLYAAEFASPGRVLSFDIAPDGRLVRRSSVESLGSMAVAVDVDHSGRRVYVAHLGDGVLSAFPINPDGTLAAAQVVTGTTGTESADGSSLHEVRVTPEGDGVVVTDYGCDEVVTYGVDGDPGMSWRTLARVSFPAGSGPRHLEFHPSGKVVYVVCEHDSTLYIVEADRGVPRRIVGCRRIEPPGYEGGAMPSELQLHGDSRMLFVGVRGPDCVTGFAVDESGDATPVFYEPSGGRRPRAVRIAPAGRHLLVGNWHSNDVAVFAVDDDLRLTPFGDPVAVNSPSSITFAAMAP